MESEKLIEEVRKFAVLYDQHDEKYRNVDYKEKVWKLISETLKVPGGSDECKKRWASIRDQFRRTLQKRKRKSGQAAKKKYKYKYEEILGFLLPHIAERETLSNIPSMEFQEDDSTFDPNIVKLEKDPETELQSQTEDWPQPSTSSQSPVQPTSPPPSAECSQAIAGTHNQFHKPLNVKRRGYNPETSAQECPSSHFMSPSTNAQQHPVDIFLAGLAPILKTLDPILLNQAKTSIFNIVQDFELNQLTKNERNQQMTSHLSLDTDHATFSRIVTGSNESSHSSFPDEPLQYHSPNESH